jgi:hypothetical protein
MPKRFSVAITGAILALATCSGGTVTVRQVATKEFFDSSSSALHMRWLAGPMPAPAG